MIRRDTTNDDGSPAWLLISQVEHARLSGELARHWGAGDFLPPEPASIVVPTITRHDDGWRAWDEAPKLDPEYGRPRSFLEMPLAASHEIWAQSIDGVDDLGPLAKFLVASHFLALRSHGHDAPEPEAQRFIHKYEPLVDAWLAEWLQESPIGNTAAKAQTAIEHLQLFDYLSLWLCCAEEREAKSFATPGGATIEFRPHSNSEIVLAPWPLRLMPAELRLAVVGRRVAAKKYTSAGEFLTALEAAPSETLTWRLAPAGL